MDLTSEYIECHEKFPSFQDPQTLQWTSVKVVTVGFCKVELDLEGLNDAIDQLGVCSVFDYLDTNAATLMVF